MTDTPEPSSPEPSAPAPAAGPEGIRRGRIGLNVAVQITLGVLLFALVNVISWRRFRQWDYTYSRSFTLAPSTETFLADVKTPVRVSVLTQRGGAVEKDLVPLLDQYRRLLRNRLRLEYIDTLRDVQAWENFKVTTAKSNIRIESNGILVQSDPAQEGAPVSTQWIPEENLYDLDREKKTPIAFKGESLLNSALRAVTNPDRPRVAWLTDIVKKRMVPEGSAFNVMADIAARQNIDLEPWPILQFPQAESEFRAAIIARPNLFGAQQEAVFTRLFEKPGNGIIVLLDPEEPCPEFDRFLARYGVVPQDDRVLHAYATAKGPIKDFAVDVRFLESDGVTRGIAMQPSILLGQTKSLRMLANTEQQKDQNIQIIPLMSPSDRFWAERKYSEPLPTIDEPEEKQKPICVALSLERGAAKDPRVQLLSSRMVVTGNAEMAMPPVSPQNYDFLTHSLNWVLHRDVTAPNDSTTDKVKHRFRIDITPAQWKRLFLITTVVLPLAALAAGVMIWSARRS